MKQDRLQAALAALGSTEQEVALSLSKRKIKGDRGFAQSCPIAKYLRRQGFGRAYVSAYSISATTYLLWFFDPTYYTTKPTSAVATFIRNFDVGQYPHLISNKYEDRR